MKNLSPPLCVYRKKLKKHLRKSKSFRRKMLHRLRERNAKKGIDIDYKKINLPQDAKLLRQLGTLKQSNFSKYKIKKGLLKFKIPKNFDIYKNPEIVFKTIANFRNVLLDKRVRSLELIHEDVESCVASEFLIGLVANEVDVYREKAGVPINIKGKIVDDGSHYELVSNIGIIAELNGSITDMHDSNCEGKVLFYKRDNRLNHTASSTGNDIKNQTAIECVKHLRSCLNTQHLSLCEDVREDLEMCLGEILDNAHEHCGMTAPVWFVRSYLNTEIKEKRFFDLVVMNIGRTIAETFELLPENSDAKSLAMEYVNFHEDDFDRELLINVAALQGNISSKKDEDMTRGQGSIRLIETFDAIYKSYIRLRGNDCDTAAIMNLISGSSIITFDGKYGFCRKDDSESGTEDVIVPFNYSESLKELPDSKYVKKMEGVSFPGVMLNIRIPLTGSTTPINRAE